MCNTVLVSELIDHTLRGAWTSSGGAATTLAPHALRWLRKRIGLRDENTPALPSSLVGAGDDTQPEPLPEAVRAELAELIGARYVLTDTAERLGRAGGLSYVNLIRRRDGGEFPIPDAVVLPADPEQVQEVIELCVRHDIAVVPFGGGTSVVGGVEASRGTKRAVIALDLVRLNRLVSLDPVSRTAVLQAGVRAPEAEALLAAHGYTLGHFPQSFERATIGGFAATRSAGQASSGYGRFEDMVEGVRVATPAGQWRLGVSPASAAGPDLRHLAVGSEGALGVITEVTVRVRPVPVLSQYEAWIVDGWQTGVDAVRALAQDSALADVTRLSDVDETEVQLELSGGMKTRALKTFLHARGFREPCMIVLGWEETSRARLRRRRHETRSILRGFRSLPIGKGAGESWRAHRFGGPRQRDALLDIGVCVETLETATYWSNIDELHTAVRNALTRALGGTPIVMCHVSHAYETGASLYFTVLAPRAATDPIGQWQRAKTAASDAIAEHGRGTISHHHAVGSDHRPWLGAEIGDVGMGVLTAAKQALDPTGILNPGKLVDSETTT